MEKHIRLLTVAGVRGVDQYEYYIGCVQDHLVGSRWIPFASSGSRQRGMEEWMEGGLALWMACETR